ncbi:MAG: hypothetical protein HRT73_08205 [Flavobacteriales bacterium]|nr:hypothetical protein [Flavobacteriales bacterium]
MNNYNFQNQKEIFSFINQLINSPSAKLSHWVKTNAIDQNQVLVKEQDLNLFLTETKSDFGYNDMTISLLKEVTSFSNELLLDFHKAILILEELIVSLEIENDILKNSMFITPKVKEVLIIFNSHRLLNSKRTLTFLKHHINIRSIIPVNLESSIANPPPYVRPIKKIRLNKSIYEVAVKLHLERVGGLFKDYDRFKPFNSEAIRTLNACFDFYGDNRIISDRYAHSLICKPLNPERAISTNRKQKDINNNLFDALIYISKSIDELKCNPALHPKLHKFSKTYVNKNIVDKP